MWNRLWPPTARPARHEEVPSQGGGPCADAYVGGRHQEGSYLVVNKRFGRLWLPAVLPLVLVAVSHPPVSHPAVNASSHKTPSPSPHASWLIDYSTVTAPMFAAGLPQGNPFDGVVVRGADDQDPWQCAPLGSQSDDVSSLTAGRAVEGRYTHDFLHVWTLNESTSWSWTEPACTDNLVAGFTALAGTAQAGGFDGLMLDVETYGQGNPWVAPRSSYHAVKATATKIGAALAARHEVLYMTMAYSAYVADPTTYADMPSFISGIRAGGAQVIDGNLPSYWYSTASQYASAYASLKAADPGEFVGQATYIDAAPSIETDVAASLENSDRYAWVYTDGAYGSWWGTPVMSSTVATQVEAGRVAAGLPG